MGWGVKWNVVVVVVFQLGFGKSVLQLTLLEQTFAFYKTTKPKTKSKTKQNKKSKHKNKTQPKQTKPNQSKQTKIKYSQVSRTLYWSYSIETA